MQRTQPDDAKPAKDLLGWEAPRPPRGDLVPSSQEVARAGIDVVVDGAVRHQLRIPVHREHSFRFNVNARSGDGEHRFRSS